MALDNQSDLVQQYVAGQMTPEECTQFEQAICQSSQLAEAVREARAFRLMIKHREFFKTMQLLDKIKAEHPIDLDLPDNQPINPPTNLPQAFFKSWFFKSSMLLLSLGFGFSYYAYQQHQHQLVKYKTLAINILQEHPAPNVLRLGATYPQAFVEAMLLYDEAIQLGSTQKYKEVAQKLDTNVLRTEDRVKFYLAISYLQVSEVTIADSLLSQLVKKPNVMRNKARQYLPVALIANGKIKEAKDFLKELSEEEQKMEPAKTLLENL